MNVTEFKKIMWDYSRKIEENMNAVISPVIEQYGLTKLQARILIELLHNDSHTIGSLAESICIASANISAMCKKLEAQGLLERVRKREDERVVMVVLTELGKETVIEIDKTVNDRFIQHIDIETQSFEDIILGLTRLNDILQRISDVEKK